MIYRSVYRNEYKLLATTHQQAFDDFFLTALGPGFLKAYYKAVVRNKESIAVCAINECGQMIGFATGSKSAIGYNRRSLVANWPDFIWQAIRLMFIRPQAMLRLVKNLERKHSWVDDGNYSELLSIAVLPQKKGAGIGKGLVSFFEEEATKHGCERITLTTDYYDNDSVVQFYKKNGYDVFYEFIA